MRSYVGRPLSPSSCPLLWPRQWPLVPPLSGCGHALSSLEFSCDLPLGWVLATLPPPLCSQATSCLDQDLVSPRGLLSPDPDTNMTPLPPANP